VVERRHYLYPPQAGPFHRRHWPSGWVGEEPTGDIPLDAVFTDGSVQPLLV